MESEKARITALTDGIKAIQIGWPFLQAELEDRIQVLTRQLVNTDNEQIRGRIKALQDIRDLPDTLDQERQALTASLASQEADASGLSTSVDPWEI